MTPSELVTIAEQCGAEVGIYQGDVVWVKLHQPSLQPFAAALTAPASAGVQGVQQGVTEAACLQGELETEYRFDASMHPLPQSAQPVAQCPKCHGHRWIEQGDPETGGDRVPCDCNTLAQPVAEGECKSCFLGKCVTGRECVTLGLDDDEHRAAMNLKEIQTLFAEVPEAASTPAARERIRQQLISTLYALDASAPPPAAASQPAPVQDACTKSQTAAQSTEVPVGELVALRRNAARYEVLRDGLKGFNAYHLSPKPGKRWRGYGDEGDILAGDELDKAIDGVLGARRNEGKAA